MPIKKISRTAVKINRVPGGKLVDEKMLRKGTDGTTKAALAIVLLGFLVGGGALGYFLYYQNQLRHPGAPRIVVSDNMLKGAPAKPTPAAAKIPAVVQKTVKILNTPTGYLNVRKGAGTNFLKIGTVKPGESHNFVLENTANGGWIEIALTATSTGWVAKQYAEVH